ncbi:MAG: QcrA and Rieske domain-containing protein [Candidatus Dormibacteria bacterium]
MHDPAPTPRPSRRRFLLFGLATVLVAEIAALTALVSTVLLPSRPRSARRVVLDDGRSPGEMADGEVVRFQARAGEGFVAASGGGINRPGGLEYAGYMVRTGATTRAYGSTCPHLGCGVLWRPEQRLFVCPCHASTFSCGGPSTFDDCGAVVRGPAQAALSSFDYDPVTESIPVSSLG